MCLFGVYESRSGDQPPSQTIGWKVVKRGRTPLYRRRTGIRYLKGTTHRVSIKDIRKTRQGRYYYAGIHVFLRKEHAVRTAGEIHGAKVLRVQLYPKQWVANSSAEAVYRRIKILD